MKKTLFTILLLLGITLNIYSQDYISKQEAIEDINYFFNNAEQIHPNLYFKISKSDLSKHINSIENEIKDSISVNDFSKKMRALVNYIGDGHTNVVFSDSLYAEYKKAACRLPFKIKINREEFIISETKTDKLIEGDKIVSINNIESKEFLALKKYPIVDIESFRKLYLERSFSFYLYMEYGFTEKLNLKIERNGAILNKEIELLNKTKSEPIKDYTYKTINDTVGVLQLNAFYGFKTADYRQFLDSTFNQIDNNTIKLLILDLRNNGGGSTEYGTMVLPYIDVAKYKFTQKYQVKTSKPTKDYIKENYIKWYVRPLLLVSKMGRAYLFKKDGTITDFDLKEKQLKVNKSAYKNNVCFLSSNNTYSAAADFAGAYKYAERGLIVGDTIGQPYSGYIDKISLTLPNSSLSGGVSFKKYEFVGTNEKNKHQGIAPDIYIDLDSIETVSEIYQLVINKIRNANILYK